MNRSHCNRLERYHPMSTIPQCSSKTTPTCRSDVGFPNKRRTQKYQAYGLEPMLVKVVSQQTPRGDVDKLDSLFAIWTSIAQVAVGLHSNKSEEPYCALVQELVASILCAPSHPFDLKSWGDRWTKITGGKTLT